MDAIGDFQNAMHEAGIIPPEVIEADGLLHRFRIEGDKRGTLNGWYILHLDGRAAGIFGNWKTGLRQTWATNGRRLDEAEREAFAELVQSARAKAEAERRAGHEAHAIEARREWEAASPAPTAHPYLIAKGVQPHGLRQAGAALLVPLFDAFGLLWNVQRIQADGSKRFRPGRAGGLFSPIGDLTDPRLLLICEGWATGATLHEESGHPVLCAMNAGNLLPVAKAARTSWPAADLVICADNDRSTAGNPGLTAATAAAKATGAGLAVPPFADDEPGTDWNDLVAIRGSLDLQGTSGTSGVPADVPPKPAPALAGTSGTSGTSEIQDVPILARKSAPRLGGTEERNEQEIHSSLKSESGQGDISPSLLASHSIGDVPDVPDVPASSDAGFHGTASGTDDVPGVPLLADLIEAAAVGDGGGEPAVVLSVQEEDRPCFRVYDEWTKLDTGKKLRPGVWHHGMSRPKKDEQPAPVDSWVCGPLHIEAQTFDGTGNNFGRLLRFKNTAGRWRSWAMPMELLKGDGSDLRGELLAMGLELDPFARQSLARYLQERAPFKRVRCALQVGWCDSVFVLPDAVIGPGAADVIFQSGERGHEEHGQAGTLDRWREEIAARAVGNPLFLLALSAAFAGPLLKCTNTEGGGLHFVGDSSTGKTTILEAACSVWGGPGYRRSWRATANGMEGAAALFNDCLLALDEISECEPREVGAIVYSLGNGRGKQRASRTGSARSVTRWAAFIVSTGERTIATTMQEGGHRTKAGQAVRLLDIPASRRYGCFDELHGMATGTALSDAIKRAATTHHGRAGRAFLERLTHDGRDFAALLERIKGLAHFNGSDFEGQDKRAAGRFALLALAGEVATEYGITGWPEGAAIDAAAVGFKSWRSLRGKGNDERRQILERLAGFLERHGDSRFSSCAADSTMVRERAGWWRPDGQGGRLYLFNSDGMKEALQGFDFKRALDVLEEAGVIPKANASGERSKTESIGGRKVRVYQVRADALHGGGDGA